MIFKFGKINLFFLLGTTFPTVHIVDQSGYDHYMHSIGGIFCNGYLYKFCLGALFKMCTLFCTLQIIEDKSQKHPLSIFAFILQPAVPEHLYIF